VSFSQVYLILNSEIYEKNIEIKQSAFHDASDWGSMVDPSSVAVAPNR